MFTILCINESLFLATRAFILFNCDNVPSRWISLRHFVNKLALRESIHKNFASFNQKIGNE